MNALTQADRRIATIRQLFSMTIRGDYDSERAWGAVTRLRRMGSVLVFDQARRWSVSNDPHKRSRAADVLSQLRQQEPTPPRGSGLRPSTSVFREEEAFQIVADMLAPEFDLQALISEIYAFGHIGNTKAVPLIVPFADNPDKDVRYAVAFALGQLHEHRESTPILMKLMKDSDKHIRDWATFGVGVLGDADSEELRIAFIARLDDSFRDARQEAAASLAKRHDIRVVKPLIAMFEQYGDIYCLCDAARDLLELENTPDKWSAKQYIAALRAAFPDQTGDSD